MKYYLSILGIFKNEGHCINEWIQHYIDEGVDHFYLIDNGSNDGYNIDDKYHHLIDLIIDPEKYQQVKLYNYHYFNKIKSETEWIIVADLDEFFYSRKGYKKISDYLKLLPEIIEQISIPGKLFGSSGYIYQPKNIIKHFIYRKKLNCKTELKSIIRTKYLTSIGIHISYTINQNILCNNILLQRYYNPLGDISEDILNNLPIHCNHYKQQSFEFYETIKRSRGDVTSMNNERIRTRLDFFNKTDFNAIHYDDELKSKKYGLLSDNNLNLDDIVVYGNTKYIILNDNEDYKKYDVYFDTDIPKYVIIRKNNTLTVIQCK